MSEQAAAPDEASRRRWRVSPGVVVLVSFVALVVVIGIGVAANLGAGEGGPRRVTVADLKGDPDRYDEEQVTLVGRAEDVRELPVLSQFAVYTFRDETDSILVLSQKGAPPDDGQRVELTGTYHSRTKLDQALADLVDEQLGPLAGTIVDTLLPGVPLNVAFLEHERYTRVAE